MVLLLDLEPLFDPGFLPLLLNVLDLRVRNLEDLLSTLLDLLRRPNDLDAEPDLRDLLVSLLVLLVGEGDGDVALELLSTVKCGEGIMIFSKSKVNLMLSSKN